MGGRRWVQAVVRGVAAAVLGGVLGAVLTRGLMRLVILVADGFHRFTWTGLAFIALFYVVFLTPGAVAVAASSARWAKGLLVLGAVAIPVQASGIAQTDLEASGPFSAQQWALFVPIFLAMAGVYALQGALVYRVAGSGRRDREGEAAAALVGAGGGEAFG
jgi:hypothetical protein